MNTYEYTNVEAGFGLTDRIIRTIRMAVIRNSYLKK